MKPTTRRCLERLRAANGGYVRGMDLAHPDVGGLRFGARLQELRDAGYEVRRRPDPSGKTHVAQYALIENEQQQIVSEGQAA